MSEGAGNGCRYRQTLTLSPGKTYFCDVDAQTWGAD